ncbi:MAG TPA: aminotransferase class V-fold PLP-dependent enzyme [Miltoncostaeaceae bacterium]|nr:aminotransferase class V-fold PLP-dependent enzyme [Miltoncostaeaceae bacterium]
MRPIAPALHAALPSLADETYLNTGGCGPLTRAAADALAGWAAEALARGRGSLEGFGRTEAASVALRDDLGRLMGDADGARIALTGNTTDGLNRAAWGVDIAPGDEIVTPALEYPGTLVLLANLARRRGATLRLIDPEGTEDDLEAAVGAVAGPRTRLVVVSHVSWSTGALLDVAGAVGAARRAGAAVLVDAAQSAGAIPVDAAALGADAVAFPAHKWLLGPEGLGGLWIAPEAEGRIDLTFTGFETGRDHRPGGGLALHPGARRHEAATLPAALLPAWSASLRWLEGEVGWDRVFAGTRAAQAAARAALAAIAGVDVLTPPGSHAGLVSFTVDGRAPEAVARRLAADGVIVRWVRRPEVLRASLGFFTTDADVARLADAVAAVATGGDC